MIGLKLKKELSRYLRKNNVKKKYSDNSIL